MGHSMVKQTYMWGMAVGRSCVRCRHKNARAYSSCCIVLVLQQTNAKFPDNNRDIFYNE